MSALKSLSGNPIIRNKFTSDPTAIVYNNKVYLYTGHDEAPVGTENYVMNDWLCFSSENLVDWEDHGAPLQPTNFEWSSGGAYATKVIQHKDKFYWFVSVKHKTIDGTAIGVAVSSDPTKGFADAIGAALVTHDMLPPTNNPKANLDPTVLIDDDGQGYLFWGNKTCYFAKLAEDLLSLKGDIETIDLPGFEEGSHIHKRKGWYYLSYGCGMPEKVAYAMSRTINGPWKYKGILNDFADNCETNRPCIIHFKGRDYFIYHNGALKNGGSHRRSVCIDYLFYNGDETIQPVVMTSGGVEEVL